ncbi:MAG TPA: hypothetical protein VGV37_06325 [Aliidongia sp.]|uniref:hypothetical protein n=1 Tax=Aliidongia sp. TaxID=1914230 RepID=UPI002DDCB09A|nr:hypothetical protein [Aliidongia sp.]HEV2674141.1 hypothetical protein [Aliidongia sp.]
MNEDDDLPEEDAPEFDSATDPKQLKRKVQRKKFEADEAGDFWRHALSVETGRREVWKILEAAGTFKTNFSASPVGFPDRDATMFILGQRELGQWLWRALTVHDRDGVWLMQSENDEAFKALLQPARKSRTVNVD